MCSIERLFARMFVRLTCCVSRGIARARSFVCDRGHVVAVAVSRPGRRARRAVAVAVASAVFSSPSCGCDTPMDASVCNGLCGVCVVLVCYLTG